MLLCTEICMLFVGRTGRAGKSGRALTFFTEADFPYLRKSVLHLGVDFTMEFVCCSSVVLTLCTYLCFVFRLFSHDQCTNNG